MRYSPSKVRASLTVLLFITFAGASADYLFGQSPAPPIRALTSDVPADTSVVINNRDTRAVDSLSTTGLAMLGTGMMTLLTLLINSYFADRKSVRENDSRFKDLAQDNKDQLRALDEKHAQVVSDLKAEIAARDEELTQHRHDTRDRDSTIIGGMRAHLTANTEAINALIPVAQAAAKVLPSVPDPNVTPIDPLLYSTAAKATLEAATAAEGKSASDVAGDIVAFSTAINKAHGGFVVDATGPVVTLYKSEDGQTFTETIISSIVDDVDPPVVVEPGPETTPAP